MRKYTGIFVIFILISLKLCGGIDWSGYLSMDDRFLLKKDHSISFEEYRLCLMPQIKDTERLKFYSEIWFRIFDLPDIQTLADLTNNEKITLFDIDLREAYLDIYGLPLKNFDIRIGRQRISWGVADKINPTDNLNPDDLEDIWDFGRHLGSEGIKIDGYLFNFNITSVFLTKFTPAVLPSGTWLNGMYSTIDLPPGLTLQTIQNSIIMPGYDIKNSIIGLKLKKNIAQLDMSISYARGRDDIPILKKTTVIPCGPSGEVDIFNELIFPRMQIFGADLTGAIGDIGVWAEGALFLPERVNLLIDMTQLQMGVLDSLILDKKPYLKYVLGLDYTFKNGCYINLQYAHGFFQERAELIEDYLLIGLEWNLFDERLKLMPVNCGIEIKDFAAIKNNYALVYAPEILYKPFENCEISLGIRLIEGSEQTNFGRFKNDDVVGLKVKYSF